MSCTFTVKYLLLLNLKYFKLTFPELCFLIVFVIHYVYYGILLYVTTMLFNSCSLHYFIVMCVTMTLLVLQFVEKLLVMNFDF